jgi:hypothetical protein
MSGFAGSKDLGKVSPGAVSRELTRSSLRIHTPRSSKGKQGSEDVRIYWKSPKRLRILKIALPGCVLLQLSPASNNTLQQRLGMRLGPSDDDLFSTAFIQRRYISFRPTNRFLIPFAWAYSLHSLLLDEAVSLKGARKRQRH